MKSGATMEPGEQMQVDGVILATCSGQRLPAETVMTPFKVALRGST